MGIDKMNEERTLPGTKIKYTLFFVTVFSLIALASVMLLICKSTNGIVSIGAFGLSLVAAVSAVALPPVFLTAGKRKLLTWWQIIAVTGAIIAFVYIFLFV